MEQPERGTPAPQESSWIEEPVVIDRQDSDRLSVDVVALYVSDPKDGKRMPIFEYLETSNDGGDSTSIGRRAPKRTIRRLRPEDVSPRDPQFRPSQDNRLAPPPIGGTVDSRWPLNKIQDIWKIERGNNEHLLTATKDSTQASINQLVPAPAPGKRTLRKPADKAGEETPVNWLSDGTFHRLLPVARVIGLGLDVARNVHRPLDFDAAAAEVGRRLSALREGSEGRAIVFVGHGYGCVLIAKLLDESRHQKLFDATAAAALFAVPLEDADSLIAWTTASLNIKKTAKIFSGQSLGTPVTSPLKQMLRDSVIRPDLSLHLYSVAMVYAESTPPRDATDPTAPKETEPLKGTHNRREAAMQAVGDVARFEGPQDASFRWLTKYLATAVESYQILKAAKSGNKDMAIHLVNQSANLNLTNMHGETALHVAARHDSRKVIEHLLGSGSVDINHRDVSGKTALHVAVEKPRKHGRAIVKLLLEAGARRDLKNNDGKTPVEAKCPSLPQEVTLLLRTTQWVVRGPPSTDLRIGNRSALQEAACKLIEMSIRDMYTAERGAKTKLFSKLGDPPCVGGTMCR
ncbi:hypothetical protein VTK73DRAFT_10136 [Phialemonium thermophilum]|uniref:Uncharacterized protein n=1 Tax=Phialemonium thermophilum TaxID=223376 RepID=A0ABR3VYC3_9PEZI